MSCTTHHICYCQEIKLVELERRLKTACEVLRELHEEFKSLSIETTDKTLSQLADELEAMPEEK